jgi:hypothetical protein
MPIPFRSIVLRGGHSCRPTLLWGQSARLSLGAEKLERYSNMLLKRDSYTRASRNAHLSATAFSS